MALLLRLFAIELMVFFVCFVWFHEDDVNCKNTNLNEDMTAAALTQKPWVRIPLKSRIFFRVCLQLLKLKLLTLSIISSFEIKFVLFYFFHVTFRCHFFIIIPICMHACYLFILFILFN